MTQTNNTIRGLHTCKPQNTPQVGQIKSFAIIQMPNYTKIKSESPEKGGQYYTIMTVEKTNYSDAHGNISFNLDLEPSDPPQQQRFQQPPQTSASAPVARQNGQPAVLTPPDSVEQHIMRSANLYLRCLHAASAVMRDVALRHFNVELSVEDLRQIATTLYIDAKNSGYISHMPDTEEKRPKSQPF